MSTWFTETAWPPIMILATAGGAGIALFFTTQRVKYLLAMIPLILLGPVIYAYERRTVTERERVEQSIYEVTAAFERQDRPEVLRYFGAQEIVLRTVATWAVDTISADGPLNVTDVAVTMHNNDSRADSHFRVNGSISVMGPGKVGHRASRWELTWQKQGGEWRIIDVHRLDPISGERMNIDTPNERATR
jgi:hypothetical protein